MQMESHKLERLKMTETLFAFDVRNYQECQKAFRGQKSQEYYLGDYSIERDRSSTCVPTRRRWVPAR